ncbi:MAG: acetyl-CoA acetyltransferase [Actinomycetota bacterium]
MQIDPRTPVIVGVAQITQRPDDPAEAMEPVALMEHVVRAAADDAGAPALAASLDYVGVVQGAWSYSDPARLVADALGATGARTAISANGGNTPQSYVNALSARIAAGELDRAAIVGAEAIWSRRRQKRAGLDIARTAQTGVEPDERFGADVPMTTEFENARGMEQPINYYPLFDSAVRASRGETIDEHRDRLAELWARFNEVAVANPYAWFRTPMTAAEIRDASPSNRMVGFPYTKSMNSNWDLDQGAALLLCSAGAAEAAGVPRDRWVFPHAGTDAHDTYAVSARRDLHSSPAIAEAGRRLFELTGTGPDDVAHIDLYSCFPSAVQVAAAELGFDEDRRLTQTGGLTFAGGPLNNYVTHSIAAMVGVLREHPGQVGLVSANGGFLTKHAIGLYATEPGRGPFVAEDVQDVVDRVPTTPVDQAYAGSATIEAYTVMHGAEGAEVGLCALRTPDGARTWGRVVEPETAAAMTRTEMIGTEAELGTDGALTLSRRSAKD